MTITPANILLNLSKANEQRLKVIEKNVELLISNKPQLLVPVELTIPKAISRKTHFFFNEV